MGGGDAGDGIATVALPVRDVLLLVRGRARHQLGPELVLQQELPRARADPRVELGRHVRLPELRDAPARRRHRRRALQGDGPQPLGEEGVDRGVRVRHGRDAHHHRPGGPARPPDHDRPRGPDGRVPRGRERRQLRPHPARAPARERRPVGRHRRRRQPGGSRLRRRLPLHGLRDRLRPRLLDHRRHDARPKPLLVLGLAPAEGPDRRPLDVTGYLGKAACPNNGRGAGISVGLLLFLGGFFI